MLNASGLSRAASFSRVPPPPVATATLGKEKRPIWPYLKAAKQQFFNVVMASLAIVMALRMLDGKARAIPLHSTVVLFGCCVTSRRRFVPRHT